MLDVPVVVHILIAMLDVPVVVHIPVAMLNVPVVVHIPEFQKPLTESLNTVLRTSVTSTARTGAGHQG